MFNRIKMVVAILVAVSIGGYAVKDHVGGFWNRLLGSEVEESHTVDTTSPKSFSFTPPSPMREGGTKAERTGVVSDGPKEEEGVEPKKESRKHIDDAAVAKSFDNMILQMMRSAEQ